MVGTSGTTRQATTSRTDVSLIAHRGFAGVYPENTVAAIERATTAASPGGLPEMVEVDVMPTADGEIVTFHDYDLGRLTDAPSELADRKVWETTAETLADLDVLGTGERIPTLSAVLDALPSSVGVNVEFKNPGSAEIRPGENLPPEARAEQTALWKPFAEDVLSTLSATDHDVLVSSFSEGALAAVREVDSSVPLAVVFADSIADGMEVARRYDCEAVHPPWNAIAGTPLFNAEYGSLGPFEDIDLLELAHEEGRAVNAWTVERWYEADQLRQAGVDGVIADYPGVLQFGDAGT
ncbi:glycerophosphodiester phosphodiesterase family protein [Halorussus sp. MSC15.2]|uniref:glycerophosphodiester phosphodiesterase n=1 Tax=Halorussus sp. MSC15.2 TaxID=2283638 RepID=UPI0013D7C7A4|nr:glycerophosphodiester phosphodiesterase family protein [Halorussus sp. MSC15.2]NEU56302.1 glycerophosphodiester phosphodiesterase [Halorussus sp. MSC15.2]